MKKLFATALISAIAGMLVYLGISWLLIAGVIKLIAFCFGVHVSWRVATGIYLIIMTLLTIKELFFKNK